MILRVMYTCPLYPPHKRTKDRQNFGETDGNKLNSEPLKFNRGRQFMSSRRTACSCGQLHLTIEGESSRISMCHCLACQRRTGAVMSNQARFHRDERYMAVEGSARPR